MDFALSSSCFLFLSSQHYVPIPACRLSFPLSMTEYREGEKDRESVCVREQEDEGESENEYEILRSEDEGGGVQTHRGIRVILLEKDSNFSPAPVPATTTSSQNGHSCLGRAPLPAYLCICAWHTALRRSAAAHLIAALINLPASVSGGT